jgi:molybdate transport system regulatory protein
MKNPRMRLHLWLENEDGLLFGQGRMELLARIRELGSLRKAAESLGMSYRAAWGKLKATEKAAGSSLLDRPASNRDGCRLSEFGETMLTSYGRWLAVVEETALAEARRCFPWPVEPFEGKGGPA